MRLLNDSADDPRFFLGCETCLSERDVSTEPLLWSITAPQGAILMPRAKSLRDFLSLLQSTAPNRPGNAPLSPAKFAHISFLDTALAHRLNFGYRSPGHFSAPNNLFCQSRNQGLSQNALGRHGRFFHR